MGGGYFDNSATTPVHPEVMEVVNRAFSEVYGNPSSLHRKGLQAENLLDEARKRIGGLLAVEPQTLVFTSGGTEANNLALRGAAAAYRGAGGHLVATAIEHDSVKSTAEALEQLGFKLTVLPVDEQGKVSKQRLLEALRDDTVLVSIMAVNNELGTVQPLEELGAVIRQHRGTRRVPVFHVDAVQAFGKVSLKPKQWGIDLMSISAHKIHGPKGVGALYRRPSVRLEPLMTGGEQESGIRPGTENVPGIAGFGKAAQLMRDQLASDPGRMRRLRERVKSGLKAVFPSLKVNGPESEGAAPQILNVSIPGVRGEVLVHALEKDGFYLSTGSACSSRKVEPSHVLKAIGCSQDELESAVRISFSPQNTEVECDALVKAVKARVEELRRFS